MNKIKTALRERGFIGIFLAVSLLSVGLFYEFLSCAASAALCVYLAVTAKKNKGFVYRSGLALHTAVVISLFYGLTAFWAVDSGMAFIGFFKFMPIVLFVLAVSRSKDCAAYLDVLPPTAALMTAVSGILALIPPLSPLFAPAGRLAGFLMYSNTFALVLLAALIITVMKEKLGVIDHVYLVIFLLGILLSGSRTVFALTLLAVILLLIFHKNKRTKITLLIVTAAGVAAGALYALISGSFDSIGRFLTTSFGESTFVGRLLYFGDALPIILKHPFGTGYLGSYYLQQSIQTGLYSVRYIHNDLLQLMLDIGWIPAVMLVAAAARAFFRKGAPLRKRLLLLVMSAHCMFDFDLQFVALFFVYFLLLDCDKGKEHKLKNFSLSRKLPLFGIGLCSVYMMIPLIAAFANGCAFSNTLYPFNTDVKTVLLTEEEDPAQMNELADKIIAQNKYVTVAYSAKAAYAYTNGDFANVIKYKELALKNAPLIYEEYESYAIMLITGYELYVQAGDIQSAEYCRDKLRRLPGLLASVENRLSAFGKKINDQPQTQFPRELLEHINAV